MKKNLQDNVTVWYISQLSPDPVVFAWLHERQTPSHFYNSRDSSVRVLKPQNNWSLKKLWAGNLWWIQAVRSARTLRVLRSSSPWWRVVRVFKRFTSLSRITLRSERNSAAEANGSSLRLAKSLYCWTFEGGCVVSTVVVNMSVALSGYPHLVRVLPLLNLQSKYFLVWCGERRSTDTQGNQGSRQ